MNRIRVDFPHYLNFFISWKTKPRPLKLSVGYLLKTPVLLVNLLRLTQFSLGCNIPSPQMQLVAKFPLVCIATKAITHYLNATSFLICPSTKDGMLLSNNPRCLNPFQSGHNYNCNMSCKRYWKNHHDLLHWDFPRNDQNLTVLVRSRAHNKVTCTSASSILNNCLLPTARVKLSSTTRCFQTTALLDSGSYCNLITKNLARRIFL